MSEYFTPSGIPAFDSDLDSVLVKSEFAAVGRGFQKFPTLAGSPLALVAVNASGTALEAIDLVPLESGGTGATDLAGAISALGLTEDDAPTFGGATIAGTEATLEHPADDDTTKAAVFHSAGGAAFAMTVATAAVSGLFPVDETGEFLDPEEAIILPWIVITSPPLAYSSLVYLPDATKFVGLSQDGTRVAVGGALAVTGDITSAAGTLGSMGARDVFISTSPTTSQSPGTNGHVFLRYDAGSTPAGTGEAYVGVDGVWRTWTYAAAVPNGCAVRLGGVWRNLIGGWGGVGGAWRQWFGP